MTKKITDLEGRLDAALMRAKGKCDGCRERKMLSPFAISDGRVFDLCADCRKSWADRIARRLRAKTALTCVKSAHDNLAAVIEDPDGTNDAEHDAAVRLLEELNAYYQEVK